MVKHIQTIGGLLLMNCLSVFDHFAGLVRKGLKLLDWAMMFVCSSINFFKLGTLLINWDCFSLLELPLYPKVLFTMWFNFYLLVFQLIWTWHYLSIVSQMLCNIENCALMIFCFDWVLYLNISSWSE